MGTVMGWVDKKGTKHQTLVLDAPYRNAGNNFSNGTAVYTPSFVSSNRSWYFNNGSSFSSSNTPPTDAVINNTTNYVEDNNSSRANTTSIVKYLSSTAYAAGFCRSKTVKHKGVSYACDLPNIQTLIRIYASMVKLDELDTSNATARYFTRKKNRKGDWCFAGDDNVWSSSMYNQNTVYHAYDGGHVSVISITYANTFGACPILELEDL